MIELDCIRHFD